MKIIGYEFAPKAQYQSRLNQFVSAGGWAGGNPAALPAPARPVFADDAGDTVASFPSEDQVATLPFVPGSTAELGPSGVSDRGGYISVEDLPSANPSGASDPFAAFVQSTAASVPSADTLAWLQRSATRAMLGGASGGGMQRAMKQLGIDNPAMAGIMGVAMQNAAQADSKGAANNGMATSLLPALNRVLQNPSLQGAANAAGQAAIGQLLQQIGLGGASQTLADVASAVGGLSNSTASLADLVTTGGFAGPLDDTTAALSDVLGDAQNATDLNHFTNGGCVQVPGEDAALPTDGISADQLSAAADELLSEWEVDDESSAAEQIAHKTINDNKDQISAALTDPDGFIAKLNKMLNGEAPGTGQPAVRIKDLDDEGDKSMIGVANILFEGEPVSRMNDLVAGPKAPAPGLPIIEGAATVLSAGVATAFVDAKTAVPSKMKTGAQSILVGGAIASVAPPAPATAPGNGGNAGPSGPAAPSGPSSGSNSAGNNGTGANGNSQAGSSTAGNPRANGNGGNVGDWDPASEADRDKLNELQKLPPGTHDPHDPISQSPFELGSGEDQRYWDPETGWSSSPGEYNDLPDTPGLRDWMQAGENESGWFGNPLKPGNWYLLGGLVDLGSPVMPGAGTGSTWWVPDKIFGMDMSSYFVPHDWKFHPSDVAHKYEPWKLFTEAEIPAFLSGLAATGGNPVHAGLQVIYSGATTSVALASWASLFFGGSGKSKGSKP